MKTSQLSALPDQPMPFRERAAQAVTERHGEDLAAYLTLHHDHEVAEAAQQAVTARNAAAQTAAQAGIDQQMLGSVMNTVRPMLRTSGENAARASHYTTMVEAVRTLLRESEAAGLANVDADALRQVLNVPAMPPAFRPLTAGFVPSDHYRIGHFRHVNTGAEWHLPFAGYVLCEETPDRPMAVHVAFLHMSVVRPRPQLYAEFGMVMEVME
jgi:hypothetical protein